MVSVKEFCKNQPVYQSGKCENNKSLRNKCKN